MSFFNSLQQYVTSGVAGLGLSPRRFSLSRQPSEEPNATGSGATISAIETAASIQAHHGFPKVVPAPGTMTTTTTTTASFQQPQASIRRQSRALECLAPPRKCSFRQRQSPILQPTPPERPALVFCKRRSSWPDFDPISTSNVKETDGSYFECFTLLAINRDDRRMSATRVTEKHAEKVQDCERDAKTDDEPEELDQLYVDVLYTISNTVGAPAPGGQFTHYKEEMYLQAQRAFGVSPDHHYRLLHSAAEEKQKIVVLTVHVQEADGLEAKDANANPAIQNTIEYIQTLPLGFSDPYCMLGIQPAGAPISPQPPLTPRALSDVGFDSNTLDSPHNDKLRKHHSFRLSFKRKDGSRREQRDLLGCAVPAKFIRATTIRPHTLSPKWDERFKFDIDDINTDIFHLDIWDHDDESCVLDAVSRLNQVRGVRGLGRFFKQVAQSARQGSQDDFLGCINLPIAEIPSTGLDGWFKLEARSQRSTVQGRIRFKLWLSTRDDRGTSEEDNTCDVFKLARLQKVIMLHEIAKHEPSWTWHGEFPGPARTICHQMAVQGDLTELQCALANFVAVVKVNMISPLDPKQIHRMLNELDRLWNQPQSEPLSKELQLWLAEAMSTFVDKSLEQIRKHRDVFPALHPPSLNRLEFLLRCLGVLTTMKAFRQVCPFNKGVRGEIVAALRKGSMMWAENNLRESQKMPNAMVCFTSTMVANLRLGLSYYHSVFDITNGIQYFSIIYKQLDTLLAEEVLARMNSGLVLGTSLTQCTVLEGDTDPPDVKPFELYLVLQEFVSLKEHLPSIPVPPEKTLSLQNYHEWFQPSVERWIMVSKAKAIQRVRAAIQRDRIAEGERIVRHSSSSVDTASCLYQMRRFIYDLGWPDPVTFSYFETQIIEAACSTAMHYHDLIQQALSDARYYEQKGPFHTSDGMCVTANNLEYVRRELACFWPDAHEPQETARAMLENSLQQLLVRVENVLGILVPSMEVALQKAVFHLAWSPESLPTGQAIVPLLEYMDVHLAALNNALLAKNFTRALTLIWSTVVAELARQMDSDRDSEKPSNFHDRLYEALHLLVDFFHADGLGLSMDALHSESFWWLEQRLQYHKKDTDRLIDLFYQQRLQEQMSVIGTSPSPYGVLAVRAYFNHDSLCVEVLHGRDIIPLDPNGFSDPFVIVELMPRRIFGHCDEIKTSVQKKTLNPDWEECYEFTVSLEQCSHESAMICFTVMDHDVLTANDFAGEAFLALGNVPGVTNVTSVDNFHGLKQIDLPLMQLHDRNHPILQILETRVGDRTAQEFVRKQKERFSSGGVIPAVTFGRTAPGCRTPNLVHQPSFTNYQ